MQLYRRQRCGLVVYNIGYQSPPTVPIPHCMLYATRKSISLSFTVFQPVDNHMFTAVVGSVFCEGLNDPAANLGKDETTLAN